MGNNRWHKICFCVRPARKKCKRACSIQEHLTVGHKQYYHIFKQQYYRYKQYYYTSISRVSVAIESIHVVVLEDTRVFFLFVICCYFYFVVVLFCSLCCNYFLSIVLVRFFFFILVLILAFVLQLVLLQLLLYSCSCSISCSPCSSYWTYCSFLFIFFLGFYIAVVLALFQAHFLFST